jgi:hypothetical protein
MNLAEVKRQILMDSDSLGVRRKITEGHETGLTNEDVVEMGEAFEKLVDTKGWTYIDIYMMKQINPMSFIFGNNTDEQRGEAKGLAKLMQYIDQMIKAKNDVLRKANKDGASET